MPHKLATPQASSPHSFASQKAFPVREDANTAQDSAIKEDEPACTVKEVTNSFKYQRPIKI